MGRRSLVLKHKPFASTRLEEDRIKDKGAVFSVWLNNDEISALSKYKELLQQDKDSTVIKQLAELGKILIDSDLTGSVMSFVLNNIRKNDRLGIAYVEAKTNKTNINNSNF